MTTPILDALPNAGQLFHCAVCARRQTASAAYQVGETAGLVLLACPSCFCLQFEPPPDLDYHHHTDDRRQIEAYVEAGAGLESIFGYIAGAPTRRAETSFLDVGAGYGFAVDIARHAFGWDAIGIEPSTYGRAGAAALDLPILPGLLTADGPLAGRRFDIVHASEVIEHVLDPHGFVGLLVGYLAADGILVLSTPSAAAVSDPALSDSHKLALLSPGAHARLFSREGLTSLLAAHGLVHVAFADQPGTLVCTASAVPFLPRRPPAADEAALRRYYTTQFTRHAAVPLLRRAFGNRLYAHLVHHNCIEDAQELWPRLGIMLPWQVPDAWTAEAFHDAVPPSAPYLAYLHGMALLLRGAADRRIIAEAIRLFDLSYALARRKIVLMPHQATLEASFLWLARLHAGIAHRQVGDEQAAAQVAQAILADPGDGFVPAPDAAIRARAEALLVKSTGASAMLQRVRRSCLTGWRRHAWRQSVGILRSVAKWMRAVVRRKLRGAMAPVPRYQGYVDERSVDHVAGWLRDLATPSARLMFEVVVPGVERERILHRGVADQFSPTLRAVGVAEGDYAFHIRFVSPLSADERDVLFVRPAGTAWQLELAPELRTTLANSVFPVPATLAAHPDASAAPSTAGDPDQISAAADRPVAAARQSWIATGPSWRQLVPRFAHRLRAPWGVLHSLRRRIGAQVRRRGFRPIARTAHWQGFVDERSRWHIAGWALDTLNPGIRPELEILVRRHGQERVLQRVRADEFSDGLQKLKIGDGFHGFFAVFDPPLGAGEDDWLVVRIAGTPHEIPAARSLKTEFAPISHIALDLVNNCNLRCPFCVYDYTTTNKTDLMSDDTFRKALTLIPFVKDANFWLSCLHEPTLHPRLAEFIGMIPPEYRNKVFFTTNLAKRLTDQQLKFLAESGIHHINISMESFDKAVYEKLRKGARFEIFMENLRKLVAAFSIANDPPRIRFIILPFKSNINELKSLISRTKSEFMAWQNELRYVFDMTYIDPSFKDEEFIRPADWERIRAEFRWHSPERLVLVDPSDATPPADANVAAKPRGVPRPLNIRIEHSGYMYVYGAELHETPQGVGYVHKNYVLTNINDLRNPLKFLVNI